MFEKIVLMLEDGKSYDEIAKEFNISIDDVRKIDEMEKTDLDIKEDINNEEIYSIDENSIKRFYDPAEIINLNREIKVLLKEMKEKISISYDKSVVYLGKDKIVINISSNGNLILYLGTKSKDRFINDYELNLNLKTVIVETQMRLIREIIELPKYIVEHRISIFSGKEYIVWRQKSDNRVSMVSIYEKGIEKLKKQITDVEYQTLKEELDYTHKINREPIYNDEEDEIYGGKPEDFVSREAELKELLQIVLDIRGSNRKLLYEEEELLKEIYSEIGNIIGE